jgi:hypothetical protein
MTAVFDSAQPSLDDVAREFPRWHCWEGVAGMLYAKLERASPPVVLRGEGPADLRDSIVRWLADH